MALFTKIIRYRASVNTQQRLWRRDFCDGAKLRRTVLKSEASHALVQSEHLFGPSRKYISRSEAWIPLRRKRIFKSEDWNLVHQTLSANRVGKMFDVNDLCRPGPFLLILHRIACLEDKKVILYSVTIAFDNRVRRGE